MKQPEVYCSCCSQEISGDPVADHRVYSRVDGELKYIELAHIDCARTDNKKRGYLYWAID